MLRACTPLQGQRRGDDSQQHAEGAVSFSSQLRLALTAAPARSEGPRSKAEDSAQAQQAKENAEVLNEVSCHFLPRVAPLSSANVVATAKALSEEHPGCPAIMYMYSERLHLFLKPLTVLSHQRSPTGSLGAARSRGAFQRAAGYIHRADKPHPGLPPGFSDRGSAPVYCPLFTRISQDMAGVDGNICPS